MGEGEQHFAGTGVGQPVIRLHIDECLTPDLVDVARARWIEANHVSRVGRAGAQDWQVVNFAITTDHDLVTNNARDFRRLYRRTDVHPRLVIMIPQGRAADQISLFRKVLDYIESHPDIVNRLVEIDHDGRPTVTPWSSTEG